jgi:hypothetical protein
MVICLQRQTVFWIGGRITSLSYWMFMGLKVLGRQIHTSEQLVSEPILFKMWLMLRRYKLPHVHQIQGELMQARGKTSFGIHKNSICLKLEINTWSTETVQTAKKNAPLRHIMNYNGSQTNPAKYLVGILSLTVGLQKPHKNTKAFTENLEYVLN